MPGHKAMYKGTGTINGEGNYGFMLSAIDADLTPSTDVDMFRIKIWEKDDNDTIVYDNQMGDADDEDLATAIGGGSIVIHKWRLLAIEGNEKPRPYAGASSMLGC